MVLYKLGSLSFMKTVWFTANIARAKKTQCCSPVQGTARGKELERIIRSVLSCFKIGYPENILFDSFFLSDTIE
mgnify:CR=1 FL=1